MNSHPAVRTDFYASPVGSPADAASPVQRVARWLRRLRRAYWRYKAHRAAVVILPSLDDRTLRDIGLTRHGVHTAMFGTAADRVHLHDLCWRGGTRAVPTRWKNFGEAVRREAEEDSSPWRQN